MAPNKKDSCCEGSSRYNLDMPNNEPLTPQKCCLRCHFLKQWKRSNDGGEWSWEVSRSQRSQLARGENVEKIVLKEHSLACHQKVWDAANPFEDSSRDAHAILSADRGESCFFYPYTPGMFLPAAVELERREAGRREAKKDRHLVRWSIIVGILGTVLGAGIGSILTALITAH